MEEPWISIIGGLFGLLVTMALLWATLKADNAFAKLIKSLAWYDWLAGLAALIPAGLFVIFLGVIEQFEWLRNIEMSPSLENFVVSVLVACVAGTYFFSWGFFSNLFKRRFQKS